jgi:molybdopterin synthase catalytic subunit
MNSMEIKKQKKVFTEGAISAGFIAESIAKHSAKKNIGSHSIFLGQVRNDIINSKAVSAIDYSAYEEMANEKFHEIREEAFQKFDLACIHIHHSIGRVNAGEISLFVFTSSKHRKASFDACRWIVNEIKTRVPIWGKEIFADETYEWKENR